MVCAITVWRNREVRAVHRTYLRADGRAKAPVPQNKMMLGPAKGGAVRLAQVGATLVVCEGVETALSVMEATGLPAWAALSAGGIEGLVLPDLPLAAEVVIGADHDETGIASTNRAAETWTGQGRLVRIALPTEPGNDFNDLAVRGKDIAA